MLPLGIQITVLIAIVGALIGVYWLLYKHQQHVNDQLTNMYKIINSHIQQASIHVDEEKFVRKDICQIMHQQTTESTEALREELSKVYEVLQEVRDFMVKQKGKNYE